MAVEIFTKDQFEKALPKNHRYIGYRYNQHCYIVHFGNPNCFVFVASSVGRDNTSRNTGEDSIRVWLVATVRPANAVEIVDVDNLIPLGAKSQRWITRVKGWQSRLITVINKCINTGKWIQPCPKCNQILRIAQGKGDNHHKFIVFCPTKENDRFAAHVNPVWIDPDSGEKISSNQQCCPTCDKPLNKVSIKYGQNAGRQALTCSARDPQGNFLNHYFKVLTDEPND